MGPSKLAGRTGDTVETWNTTWSRDGCLIVSKVAKVNMQLNMHVYFLHDTFFWGTTCCGHFLVFGGDRLRALQRAIYCFGLQHWERRLSYEPRARTSRTSGKHTLREMNDEPLSEVRKSMVVRCLTRPGAGHVGSRIRRIWVGGKRLSQP